MTDKKSAIINELKKVSEILGKNRFTREDLYKHSTIPITQDDIENSFGSFGKAMVAAGFKPIKWSKISDEELFQAYGEVYKETGHYPLGHPGLKELDENSPFRGHTYKHRFGGLKNFLFEYKNWLIGNQDTKPVVDSKSQVKANNILPSSQGEYFDNKQRYVGFAAQNLVVAELMFRGFQAQNMWVDEGLDVFAVSLRKNELYLIQVKHSYYDQPLKSRQISITVSSFEKHKKSNVFYIFVLDKEGVRNFLILPFQKLDELVRGGFIKSNNEKTKLTFTVTHKTDDDAFIGDLDVSRYWNAWDVLL